MKVKEVTFPWSDEEGFKGMSMFAAEIGLAHTQWYPERAAEYGPWLRRTLAGCGELRGMDVAASHLARERFRGRLRAMFRVVDLLLVPALGRVLPTWEAMARLAEEGKDFDTELVRFTSPFNIAGSPTITLPAGFTGEGLPIGIQLAGPWLSEPLLLRAGVAFQKQTDFHERHPDLETVAA
jgi:amidase